MWYLLFLVALYLYPALDVTWECAIKLSQLPPQNVVFTTLVTKRFHIYLYSW